MTKLQLRENPPLAGAPNICPGAERWERLSRDFTSNDRSFQAKTNTCLCPVSAPTPDIADQSGGASPRGLNAASAQHTGQPPQAGHGAVLALEQGSWEPLC